MAPVAAAQTVLVGGPDTIIRQTNGVSNAFTIVGACGGIVDSMAAHGTTTYIGDVSGQIYKHEPGIGVGYAFNAGNDATALAQRAGLLYIGGTDGSVEVRQLPGGALMATWQASSAVQALVVDNLHLYAGNLLGEIERALLGGIGEFTAWGACGGPIDALATDGDAIIAGTTTGGLYRLDIQTAATAVSYSVSSDVTALGMHLEDLLVADSTGRVQRIDPVTGAVHDTYLSGSEVRALAVTQVFPPGWTYCYGDGCPCGNDDPLRGCANSSGLGARLQAAGTTSVFSDDLALMVTDAPPNSFALLLMGTDLSHSPLGDGLLCTGANAQLFRFGISQVGANGSFSREALGAFAQGHLGGGAQFVPGSSRIFQVWYRDPLGPCGNGFNTTNSVIISLSL